MFLERHAALRRALPIWTLRIVVPPHLPGMAGRARHAVQYQLMEPFRDVVVNEMRWYVEQLRSSSSGEAALVSVGSDALQKAVEAGSGRVEVLELGHRYGHLSPLLAAS